MLAALNIRTQTPIWFITCAYYLRVLLACITCVYYLRLLLAFITCIYYLWLLLVCITCVYYLCVLLVCITCVYYLWLLLVVITCVCLSIQRGVACFYSRRGCGRTQHPSVLGCNTGANHMSNQDCWHICENPTPRCYWVQIWHMNILDYRGGNIKQTNNETNKNTNK